MFCFGIYANWIKESKGFLKAIISCIFRFPNKLTSVFPQISNLWITGAEFPIITAMSLFYSQRVLEMYKVQLDLSDSPVNYRRSSE